MHEPNDRGKAADLQRIQDKLRQLTPESRARFTDFLAELSKSPDILPPFPGTPEKGQ